MARYRQIHTAIWSDPRFESYSPHAKLLFIWGFSNQHRNEAGLYPISIKKMAFETGLTIEQTNQSLEEIVSSHAWKYDHEAQVLWIVNAIKYQTVNANCITAIKKDISSTSSPLADELRALVNTPGYLSKNKGNDKGNGNDKDGLPNPLETHTKPMTIGSPVLIKKPISERPKTQLPKSKQEGIPFSEIVDYLNEKAGTNYRASSQEIQKHIKARWNDKFTADDFKTVIDKKVASWKDDPEMAKYLRPSTIFGTKFEQYLNEVAAKPQSHSYKPDESGMLAPFMKGCAVKRAGLRCRTPRS